MDSKYQLTSFGKFFVQLKLSRSRNRGFTAAWMFISGKGCKMPDKTWTWISNISSQWCRWDLNIRGFVTNAKTRSRPDLCWLGWINMIRVAITQWYFWFYTVELENLQLFLSIPNGIEKVSAPQQTLKITLNFACDAWTLMTTTLVAYVTFSNEIVDSTLINFANAKQHYQVKLFLLLSSVAVFWIKKLSSSYQFLSAKFKY